MLELSFDYSLDSGSMVYMWLEFGSESTECMLMYQRT